MKKELFVYYDPEYDHNCTRKFVSQSISETIVEFLKNKAFSVLSAQELRETMLSVVKREKQKVVIVFAQDIAPDIVLDDPAPTALVRQYLDNGGTIIWLGDIPFFYQAKNGGGNRDDKWWEKGAAGNILGVNPIFPTKVSKTQITKKGQETGLTIAWSGIRPVLKDRDVIVLAETKSPYSVAHQPVPLNWFFRQLSRLRGFTVGAQGVNVGVQLKDSPSDTANLLWNRKLANAWFKNFNVDNPLSGFYRIWDYRPSVLTAQQLEDLNRMAVHTSGE